MKVQIRPLSPREKEVVSIINSYAAKHGFSPTHEFIAEHIKVSRPRVSAIIATLAKKGAVQKIRGLKQNIVIKAKHD